MSAPPDDDKTCPRCGRSFSCMADRIAPCQCLGVTLSEATAQWLKAHYSDCLCVPCLRELEAVHGELPGRTRGPGQDPRRG